MVCMDEIDERLVNITILVPTFHFSCLISPFTISINILIDDFLINIHCINFVKNECLVSNKVSLKR